MFLKYILIISLISRWSRWSTFLGATKKSAVQVMSRSYFHEIEMIYICCDHKTNNIDRPTKHSLLLSKLTNLSSAWKVGSFCRLEKKFTFNKLFFVCFSFEKIIEFKLFMKFVLQRKTNKDKSTEIFKLLILICARAMKSAKKVSESTPKGSNFKEDDRVLPL